MAVLNSKAERQASAAASRQLAYNAAQAAKANALQQKRDAIASRQKAVEESRANKIAIHQAAIAAKVAKRKPKGITHVDLPLSQGLADTSNGSGNTGLPINPQPITPIDGIPIASDNGAGGGLGGGAPYVESTPAESKTASLSAAATDTNRVLLIGAGVVGIVFLFISMRHK